MTKVECLQRTKKMLVREWNLHKPPLSDTNLRDFPEGLGKDDSAVGALKVPIETIDFANVGVIITIGELISAKTVADLRDCIWTRVSN